MHLRISKLAGRLQCTSSKYLPQYPIAGLVDHGQYASHVGYPANNAKSTSVYYVPGLVSTLVALVV